MEGTSAAFAEKPESIGSEATSSSGTAEGTRQSRSYVPSRRSKLSTQSQAFEGDRPAEQAITEAA